MSRILGLSLSMVLLLAALPLISIGSTQGPPFLWWLGLAMLGAGGLMPPVRRLVVSGRAAARPTRAGLDEDCRVS